jgi:hypothetical protein
MRARKAGAAPPGAPGSTSSRKPLTRRNVGRGLFGCVRWRTAVGDRWRASVPNTCANPGVQRSRVRREITGDVHGHAGDPQGAEMSESGEVLRSGFHPDGCPGRRECSPRTRGWSPDGAGGEEVRMCSPHTRGWSRTPVHAIVEDSA